MSRKLKYGLFFILALTAIIYVGNMSVSAYKESLKIDAFELSVDGNVWFVVEDRVGLENLLETYKSSYFKGINVNAEQVAATFEQDVQIKEVRVEKIEVTTLEYAQEMITAIDKEARIYTVVRGDSLWAIADKQDIPLSTIKSLNPDLDPELIYAGNKIMLEPQDPVLDVIVSFQSVVTETVPYPIEYIKDARLYSGARVVVKKGTDGSKVVTYSIRVRNGYSSESTVLHETEISAPVGGVVKVGTMKTLAKLSKSNFGVTTGQLSSDFGWRTDPISGIKRFHTGLDIASSYGNPIYAYTNGTVTEAGYNSTKGYYITIQHSGGLKTSYLHMSKILVSKGQSVTVGQKIGQVGSTGYSTGNHLHFSVIKNGAYLRPWDYL